MKASCRQPALAVPETQLVTKMFVRLTLPMLVTEYAKPITPPGTPLVKGHITVTASIGAVWTGQKLVALAVAEAGPGGEQILVPVAVKMFVIEQTLVGTRV